MNEKHTAHCMHTRQTKWAERRARISKATPHLIAYTKWSHEARIPSYPSGSSDGTVVGIDVTEVYVGSRAILRGDRHHSGEKSLLLF